MKYVLESRPWTLSPGCLCLGQAAWIIVQGGASLGQSPQWVLLCGNFVPWVQPSGTPWISLLDHSLQLTDLIRCLLSPKLTVPLGMATFLPHWDISLRPSSTFTLLHVLHLFTLLPPPSFHPLWKDMGHFIPRTNNWFTETGWNITIWSLQHQANTAWVWN